MGIVYEDRTPPSCRDLPMGSVECLLCGGIFMSLYRHLAVHETTARQYRARFPGAATSCVEVRLSQVRGGQEGLVRSRKPRVRIVRPSPGSAPRLGGQDAGTTPVVSGETPAVQGSHTLKVAG